MPCERWAHSDASSVLPSLGAYSKDWRLRTCLLQSLGSSSCRSVMLSSLFMDKIDSENRSASHLRLTSSEEQESYRYSGITFWISSLEAVPCRSRRCSLPKIAATSQPSLPTLANDSLAKHPDGQGCLIGLFPFESRPLHLPCFTQSSNIHTCISLVVKINGFALFWP